MTNVSTIEFQDADAKDGVVILVRAEKGRLALGVSLKSNGDIEVVVPVEAARMLIQSLRDAVVIAERLS